MSDKFLESDDSMYNCELLQNLRDKMILKNSRDRIANKGRERNWELDEIEDSDLKIINRLNHLHDNDDLIVRKSNGEFFLVKAFAVDEETARRIVVLKSLSKKYSICIHEDLFLVELSEEDKEKCGQNYLYDFVTIE